MLWIICICNIVSLLVVFSSFFLFVGIMINKERKTLGFEPKYNPKKLSLWIDINLIIALILFVIWIVNQ